jgi:hypothetical protein
MDDYEQQREQAQRDAIAAAKRLMGSAGPALAAIEAAKARLESQKKRWWQFWKA